MQLLMEEAFSQALTLNLFHLIFIKFNDSSLTGFYSTTYFS